MTEIIPPALSNPSARCCLALLLATCLALLTPLQPQLEGQHPPDQPKENQPKENQPKENQPKENQPKENQPKENQPKENQPKENQPKENQPKVAQPQGPTEVGNSKAALPDTGGYDPLKISNATPKTLLLDVQDQARNRKIPVKVYLPETNQPAPVILFSHGLGGDREASRFLGKHWAARGYLGVFLQHPGSDDSVWRETPWPERMRQMNQAANAENMKLRFGDVSAVLDQLQVWSQQAGHELAGRCDLEKIGMSGHSFGAVTTQGVSGQLFLGQPRFTDSRIKAAVIFSPSSPRIGNPQTAFGRVKLPWLLMTGTRDVAPIGNVDPENRLAVFPTLPADGCKYQLVLDQAEHSAFTDRSLSGARPNRNPNHHRVIQAISTCFWDAYLQQNSQAKAYLNDSNRIRQLLDAKDRWDHK